MTFDKISQFKFQGSFEGWLRRLTVNICLKKLKKKNFFVIIDEQKLGEEAYEENLDLDNENIPFSEIDNLIKKMPPGYQTVFNLYLIEEYSHKEIAEKLGISVGSSKSNLSRAKQWMRKALKKNKKFVFTNRK